MIRIVRTNSENRDFIELVRHLDADLAERDGKGHSFYAQFNKIDAIKYVVVAYEEGQPVGCGAIKEYAPKVMEIKRMYTAPESRAKALAARFCTSWKPGQRSYPMKNAFSRPGRNNPKPSRFIKRTGTE